MDIENLLRAMVICIEREEGVNRKRRRQSSSPL